MNKSNCFFWIFLAAIALRINAQETVWPQFRVPNCSGHASRTATPPVNFGEDSHLKWKTVIPHGRSSPVIWDNSIYITGYLEEKKALLVFSIDRDSGKMNWCDSIFPEMIENCHAISSPAQSTPTVDRDGAYVYFASGGIKCYNHDGSVKWVKKAGRTEKKWGNPVSPVIMDDKLILNLDYGKIASTPAIAEDDIYIRTSECLYAFSNE